MLVAINEEGEAHLISLVSQTIVHKYRFKGAAHAVKFSPDGKHFAVCKESNVFVFKAPGPFSGQYNAFIMERVYHGAFDETTCLDWSTDSKILAVGSKDNVARLYAIENCANFKHYSLSGHTDHVVACFFEENSLDITTIARNGHTCIWECSIDAKQLQPWQEMDNMPLKKIKKEDSDSEDDIDITKSIEDPDRVAEQLNAIALADKKVKIKKEKVHYRRLSIHYLLDDVRKNDKDAVLSAAAYHKQSKILITGFSTGAFYIHELPEVNLIHSLSISNEKISAIAMNNTGDWIALGCGGLGQLLVWEWQSETYVMKQQGHSNNMSCVSYSLDGQHLVTGGEDGKVKLWNLHSGFCVVTFSEHTGPVTNVAFCGNKKFVVSSSLDGTVRAYDVIRYRNFRTLTTPRPVQLQSVAVDVSGEFIASGGQDVFEIFLWSMKFGRLLEILSGHQGPVWSLAFNSNPSSTTLVSVSWDKTLRIWDAIEKGSAHESIDIPADGLCVAFKPDGQEVAVATLDGQITTYDVKTGTQVNTIEGRSDLGSGRLHDDLVTAKQSLKAKSFTTLCYTANGQYILAGGQSKNICIYNISEGLIVKRFEITQSRSFDGVDDFINRRKLTEFGNVALVEERDEKEGGTVVLKLPGVKKGDMCARRSKPEVRVFDLQFSPTGQQWSACTTEGLLIYSLNSGVVFDPWELQLNVTPKSVQEAIDEGEHENALTMAMKLNEDNLITKAMETIPIGDVGLTIGGLSEKYVQRLLQIIANALDKSNHLEFYLHWAKCVMSTHGLKIKSQQCLAPLLDLQKSLSRRNEQLSKLCDFNKYTMQYISKMAEVALASTQPTLNFDSAGEDVLFSDVEEE
ncbi:periodic tryptophan protein 2 homolog isoform X2 [Atheta coriaria]